MAETSCAARDLSFSGVPTYHFRFHGREQAAFTVVIANQCCEVREGLDGRADLLVQADSEAWIGFLRKERRLIPALLLDRIRLQGHPLQLLRFARCFST